MMIRLAILTIIQPSVLTIIQPSILTIRGVNFPTTSTS
jgi:hypothetical protein